jgi:hypothetical protein
MASLLPLHDLYSILIRLPEPSSSEAGETWVREILPLNFAYEASVS